MLVLELITKVSHLLGQLRLHITYFLVGVAAKLEAQCLQITNSLLFETK